MAPPGGLTCAVVNNQLLDTKGDSFYALHDLVVSGNDYFLISVRTIKCGRKLAYALSYRTVHGISDGVI